MRIEVEGQGTWSVQKMKHRKEKLCFPLQLVLKGKLKKYGMSGNEKLNGLGHRRVRKRQHWEGCTRPQTNALHADPHLNS